MLDSRGAPLGAVIVAVVLVHLSWYGKLAASGIVSGVLLLWFVAAFARAHADGGAGWHALQRAYNVTFGWGDGF